MNQKYDRDFIDKLFEQTHTIAVVGLSDNPERTSYQVSQAMQNYGFKMIPINPTIDSALGEKAYPRLRDVKEQVDIVNVFRRSIFLKDIAAEAVEIGAKVLWAQQGVVDQDVEHLYNKDLLIVMDQCIKVAYQQIQK